MADELELRWSFGMQMITEGCAVMERTGHERNFDAAWAERDRFTFGWPPEAWAEDLAKARENDCPYCDRHPLEVTCEEYREEARYQG